MEQSLNLNSGLFPIWILLWVAIRQFELIFTPSSKFIEPFLEIIKDFIIFEAGIKKVPRYQQYFATKSIVKRLTVDKEGGVV